MQPRTGCIRAEACIFANFRAVIYFTINYLLRATTTIQQSVKFFGMVSLNVNSVETIKMQSDLRSRLDESLENSVFILRQPVLYFLQVEETQKIFRKLKKINFCQFPRLIAFFIVNVICNLVIFISSRFLRQFLS